MMFDVDVVLLDEEFCYFVQLVDVVLYRAMTRCEGFVLLCYHGNRLLIHYIVNDL